MRAYRSAPQGILSPAVLEPKGAQLVAVLHQLLESERAPAEEVAAARDRQLATLLEHAWNTAPAWRRRLEAAGYQPGTAPDTATWQAIAPLERADLQSGETGFASEAPPASHGSVYRMHSSGSTGSPVETLGTDVTRLFWQAVTLRDHVRHGRDFSRAFAAVRPDRLEKGQREAHLPDWGPPVRHVSESGPSAALHSSVPIDEQAAWLRRQQPAYLLSFPSNLRELARELDRTGGPWPELVEIRTAGETVTGTLRGEIREWLGFELADTYSSQEVGVLAQQVPGKASYLVESETMHIDVVHDDGTPCAPGEIGRVLVTSLQNFAFPTIRYAVGDYAEVGEPDPDYPGLPVLNRVVGRWRNMVVSPEGRRWWPSFPVDIWEEAGDVRQFRLEQTAPGAIDVLLVMGEPLTDAMQRQLVGSLHRTLGYPFDLNFRVVEEIPRSPSGKYEDFISRM
ncbi:MAG: hypothetical protein U5K33_05190 [Halofilum sp. (in: g-proteobacteria)]|nr:hypothetical protein [Halofilum sp. (in: g-proteobacteria)]